MTGKVTGIGALAAAVLLGGTLVPAARAQKAATAKVKLSAAQARAVAQKKYRQGRVEGKPELENEEGKWQYAVMVKAGGKLHEIMVDANTGRIASEEIVTREAEAREKKAEAAKAGKGGSKKEAGGKGARH